MSVRQRAVDLLYAMCDRTNAEEIVGEMLEYLETADYSIREEMVRLARLLHTRRNGEICSTFNPFKQNGLVYPYQLDKPVFN